MTANEVRVNVPFGEDFVYKGRSGLASLELWVLTNNDNLAHLVAERGQTKRELVTEIEHTRVAKPMGESA